VRLNVNFEILDKYRIKTGMFATKDLTPYGAFFIPATKNGEWLKVICAPMDSEWQHVSVSHPRRCPTWMEMAKVKDLFWSEEETVVQFHPKKSSYINNHPYCLHLWKKKDFEHELPPSILIGIK